MRTARRIVIAAAVLVFAACSGTASSTAESGTDTGTDAGTDAGGTGQDTADPAELPPLPEGPHILMSLREEPPMLPFPWDWHTEAAEDTDTGLRIKLSGPLQANALVQPVANMFSAYVPHAELLDGFGAIGMVALPVTEAPADLPAVTGVGGPIEVRRIFDGADVLFRIEYTEYTEAGEVVRRLVELDPVRPLVEGEQYLVLVRKGLASAADGAPFEAPPLAEVVLGLRDPYGPANWHALMAQTREHTQEALDALPDAPAAEDLLLALFYTTGTSLEHLFAAADTVMDLDVEVDLDPDGDGADNITPGPEHPSFKNNPAVGLVVEGTFLAPDFRDDEGILRTGEAGVPEVRSYAAREFWLVIPAAPAAGPWPFAITQHGLNSWKETQHSWGRDYAALGIASGGFDFMYHGQGKDGGFWFLALDRPRALEDNFRQSALDMLAFERAVAGLVADLDLDVDMGRVAYTGHSLGAIMASLACPLSRTERVGGFVNGGGDFLHLIKTAFDKIGLYDALPGAMWSAFRVFSGHITSGADPALYGRHLMEAPVGDRGSCPFQLQVSLHDETVPARSGYELAVAAGAPLVEPVIEPWEWLTPTPAEGLSWGVLQFDGGHELFNGGDGPEEKARARAILFHYIDSFLHGGAPEIVLPED